MVGKNNCMAPGVAVGNDGGASVMGNVDCVGSLMTEGGSVTVEVVSGEGEEPGEFPGGTCTDWFVAGEQATRNASNTTRLTQ